MNKSSESGNEIPAQIQEQVQKTNEEVVRIYELKNKSYQMLTQMLPVMDQMMGYFTKTLTEEIAEALIKNAKEINRYLEMGYFGKELLSEEKCETINAKWKEDGNIQEAQQELGKILADMREHMVLAREQAEEQRHTCCCCNQRNFFLPLTRYYDLMQEYYGGVPWKHETQNNEEMVCPVCGSFDRERLIVLALDREDLSRKKILQFAPSNAVDNFLKDRENAGYDTCDLFMEGVSYQADIQNLDMIEEKAYDIWICSHVLEHVKDDRKAMQELYRITKPNGYGLILVPLDLHQKETEEEWEASIEERWRRFGQDDHVRKYAKYDFIKRLEASGFKVEELDIDTFGKDIFQCNALSDTSVLYKVKR